MELVGTQ